MSEFDWNNPKAREHVLVRLPRKGFISAYKSVAHHDTVWKALDHLNERVEALEGMGRQAQASIDGFRKDELDDLQARVDKFVAWVENQGAGDGSLTTTGEILVKLRELGLVRNEEDKS
jgi:hypothetical protein